MENITATLTDAERESIATYIDEHGAFSSGEFYADCDYPGVVPDEASIYRDPMTNYTYAESTCGCDEHAVEMYVRLSVSELKRIIATKE